MIELVFASVCLTIPLSGSPSVTVYPVVEFSGVPLKRSAALPFLILNRHPYGGEFHGEIRDHELVHHRQMRNLGFLSFLAGYVFSGGQPFEYYRNDDEFMMDFPTYNSCGGFL